MLRNSVLLLCLVCLLAASGLQAKEPDKWVYAKRTQGWDRVPTDVVSLHLEDWGWDAGWENKLKEFKDLEHLALTSCSVTDNLWRVMSELPALEYLVLSSISTTPGTDDMFGGIKKLKKLKRLAINKYFGLRDVHWKDICQVASVEELHLQDPGPQTYRHGNELTGLVNLKKLTLADMELPGRVNMGVLPELKHLQAVQLLRIAVNEQTVSAIVGLPGLSEFHCAACYGMADHLLTPIAKSKSIENLKLTATNFTSKGVKTLSKMKALKSLGLLNGNYLEDDVCKLITKMKKLTELDLSGCYQITEKGLGSFQKMAKLKKLTLNATSYKISDQAIDDLRILLPDCEVVRDGVRWHFGLFPDEESLWPVEWGHLLARIPDGVDEVNLTAGNAFRASDFKHLRSVHRVVCTGFADTSMEVICSHRHFTELRIRDPRGIKTESLQNIGEMSRLTNLELKLPKLNDADLAFLANLKELRELTIHAPIQGRITGAFVKQLSKLKKLESLRVVGCSAFADEALEELAEIKSLVGLFLHQCEGVTNAGLGHLQAAESVLLIDVRGCIGIDREGLATAAEKPGLRHLAASVSMGVDESWAREIKAKHAGLEVTIDE